MFLTKEQAIKISFGSIDKITEDINKNNDFLFELLNDNDWSFVIKAHALLETIITELIVCKIEETKLKPLIDKIPLHDTQVSKIKILKTYDLITKEQETFIKTLSEIRNMIVHKFENINFSFSEYVAGLDKNQKKSWKNKIVWFEYSDKTSNDMKDLSLSNPKNAIWFSIFLYVTETVVETNKLKGIQIMQNEAIKTTKELLNKV
jgi:hypothetical protein